MFQLTGKTIGSYRVLEQIGVGGMAMVYKAYHPGMDRYVAIKVLPPHLSQDPDFIKRFQREARAIAKLEHAHILPVHDYGEYEGVTYIAMRYVEAGTLKDRITTRRFSLDEINHIISQIGGALDYAHRMGVIHRDVKPGNVLIDDQGDTYLTDFGLARMMEPTEKLTASGVGLGTPAYMSPEQGRGDKVDHRSDIYSLGVILYEMVTGHVPYEAETPMAIVLKHINDELPLPRAIDPSVSTSIERVILKALAKDPADRYQTAGEMVQALIKATRESGVTTENEPAPIQVKPAPPREDISLITRLQQTWVQPRGKFMLAGGVLAVVAALGFLLTWLLPGRVTISEQGATMTPVTVVVAPTSTNPPATPIVIEPAATLIVTEAPASNGVLYFEDFEDGILQDAVLTSEISRWQIVEDETGNMVHRIDNRGGPNFPWMEFGSVEWKDYAVEFRMRFLTPVDDRWGAAIGFRDDFAGNAYGLDITPENGNPAQGQIQLTMTLNNNPSVTLRGVDTDNTADVWHTVRQEVDQDQIRTYFDGQLVIDVTDSQIQQGHVVLGAGPGAYIEFDDVRVTALGEAATVAPLPASTTTENVLYAEDFEDGKAQELLYISGDSSKLISDETGNMVYDMDNTSNPNSDQQMAMGFGSEKWNDYAIEYRVRMLNENANIRLNFRNTGQSHYTQTLNLLSNMVGLTIVPKDGPVQDLSRDYVIKQGVWYRVRVEVQAEMIRVFVDGNLVIERVDSQIDAGSLDLGIFPNTHAQFDDIRVISLGTTTASTLTPQAEQARAFAEPILQTISSREPDFADDFSTGGLRWTWDERMAGQVEIANGVMQVNGLGGHGIFPPQNLLRIKNFIFEFDVRLFDPQATLGTFFRQQDADIWYGFMIHGSDNSWHVNISVESQPPTGMGFDNVLPQGQINRVRIIARENQFAIYLNGKPTAYFEDETFSEAGSLMPTFKSESDEPVQGEFDNFKFWNITNLP